MKYHGTSYRINWINLNNELISILPQFSCNSLDVKFSYCFMKKIDSEWTFLPKATTFLEEGTKRFCPVHVNEISFEVLHHRSGYGER